MKKFILIAAVALALVAVAAFSVTGWAFAQANAQAPAQAPDPDDGACPYCGSYGPGMMGGGRGYRGQVDGDAVGPMHDEMIAALSEAFGLTPDQLQAARDEGKTLWDIAQEQGKTWDEFRALVTDARSKAISQAVSNGDITQEQADWMLERMNGARGAGYGSGMMGAGGCGGYGGRGGGRWNNQP